MRQSPPHQPGMSETGNVSCIYRILSLSISLHLSLYLKVKKIVDVSYLLCSLVRVPKDVVVVSDDCTSEVARIVMQYNLRLYCIVHC